MYHGMPITVRAAAFLMDFKGSSMHSTLQLSPCEVTKA